MPATPHVIEAFAHHGMTVTDLDKTREFLCGVLGFTRGNEYLLDEEFTSAVTGVPEASIRIAFVEASGVLVEILEYLEPKVQERLNPLPSHPGSAHLALYVGDIESLVGPAAEAGWYVANTVVTITVGPRAGGRAAYLVSRDGNVIELIQRPDIGRV